MKKLLYTAIAAIFAVSCSVDTSSNLDLKENLTHQIDNQKSNIGSYKGIFTTNNSDHRAVIEVTIPNAKVRTADHKNYPAAKITLESGEVYRAISNLRIEDGDQIEGLAFTSRNLSFTFSVDQDGANPVVENVVFQNMESSVIIAKDSNRAPVTPILGTFVCTTCNSHPNLNAGEAQTFNVLITTPSGTSTISTQLAVGSVVFNGIGLQDNCTTNSTLTTCDIISGDGATNIGFMAAGAPVTWVGSHGFNNEPAGPNDCSGASGTWNWDTPSYGLIEGTFESAVVCETVIAFEDFEDAIVNYAGPADDIGGISNEDYYGIVGLPLFDPTDNVFYDNLQGSGFYGAQDTDGNQTTTALDIITLTWVNLPISGLTTITAAGYFGEDDEAGEDWDTDSSVRLEYSFDNTMWTPLVQIESEVASGANNAPRIDTDFDGVGDGDLITPTLTEYSGSFLSSGASTVSVRLIIENLSAVNEDIAVDNILITGN